MTESINPATPTTPTTPVENPTNLKVETGQTLPLSLDVLIKTKEKQFQNGLRLQIPAYNRYRTYCAGRLRRLRKKVDFRHSKRNTKFQKLTLDAEVIKNRPDVRFLILVLFQAERAWADAMHLKQSNTDKQDPRVKIHSLKRLVKAVQHAQHLERLCKEVADDTTQLESQAYSSQLQGNLLLEKEQYADALKQFSSAKTIYSSLGDIASTNARKELYAQRANEIEPNIRFCKHSTRGDDVDSYADADENTEATNPALVLLRGKLDAVRENARARQALTMQSVEWAGRTVPVENDKIRIMIVNARGMRKDADASRTLESKLRTFDKILIAYNDAIKLVKDEIRKVQGNDKAVANLRYLHAYLTFSMLNGTAERNVRMIGNLISKQDARKKKTNQSAEIVRLYESVLLNIEDMQQLPGIDDDESLCQLLEKYVFAFKSQKCIYLAQGYEQAEKWREAYALYERAGTLSQKSTDQGDLIALHDQVALSRASTVQAIARGKLSCHAQQVLSEQSKQQQDGHDSKQQQQQQHKEETSAGRGLLDRLGVYGTTGSKPHLISFPPEFEIIPAKPVFFDIASNEISYPDVSSRLEESKPQEEKKKGWFGLW
ncbi:signal recognition particle subunit SRP68 [Acrasis kona]|uniref:Signal recognition particle subunit SRP68 n=1 Tax=Acrasis kona TaxID=1008807 RepID=A0AAW2YMB5_9EUKA